MPCDVFKCCIDLPILYAAESSISRALAIRGGFILVFM